MNIQIQRSKVRGDVKVYASVQSRSRPETQHRVVYIRNKNMRRWLCSCENFLFNRVGKNRNCDHIKAIRSTFGRFATKVLDWSTANV